SWTHLERQRGGFGFLGGPGETQIEADRRVITERIARLERDEFDLIAVGRALLVDPEWVDKVKRGDTAGLKDFSPAAFGVLA
ncbi:hypothetical protein KC221_27890, partial [Mycobacterium tuberculosis]|nr:hypothetical protein [Mycobacterium tuberculosis]